MALTMKQKYSLLDLSKLPDNLSSEFKEMKESTENFSDPDLIEVFDETFDLAWDNVKKNHPEAIKGKKSIKKAAPKKTIKPRVKKAVPRKKPIKKAAPKKTIKPKIEKQPDKITECKKIIQDAGYTVKKSIVKKKKVTKRVKRQDSTIIKEDVSKAVTTIAKDTVKTKESRDEYYDSFKILNSIKKMLTIFLQSIDKLYNDNDTEKLKKIEQLLASVTIGETTTKKLVPKPVIKPAKWNEEAKNVLQYALKYHNLKKAGISEKDIEEIEDVVIKTNKKIGDTGSSILGGGLKADGIIIVRYWTQGNMAPETAFIEIIKYLKPKYPEIKFVVDYGRMD